MGFIKPRPKLKEYKIELIPLIDIVFTLLIFFAVTSTFIYFQKGIELDLPNSETSNTLAKTLTLSLDKKGEVFIDQNVVQIQEIKGRLTPLLFKSNDLTVILSADKKVSYEKVIQVMDAIRLAGSNRIVLQTQDHGN